VATRQPNNSRTFIRPTTKLPELPNVHNIIASDTSAHILHSTMTVSFTKKNVRAIIFQSTFQNQSSTRSKTDRQQDHRDIATMDAWDEAFARQLRRKQMQENISRELAVILAKQKQRSEVKHGSSSGPGAPHSSSGPGAPQHGQQ